MFQPQRHRRLLLGTLALLGLAPLAHAQDTPWPSKPITLIVPFSPGGGVDVMARLLAEKMKVALGQPVNVENKAGGSGMIGVLAAVRSPADGHTLVMATAGETAINPHVFKSRMQYQPERDLAPVTLVVKVPNAVVVNPALPIRSIADLIGYAKANPGKISYGSSGIGHPQHLAGELLEVMSGQPLRHVPYRGASNQLTDVAGGSLDMTFVSLGGARAFIKDQRVRAIGITSARRSDLAPELPAVAETAGLAGYVLENWFGLFAPSATPPAVVTKLNGIVTQALKDPELVKRLHDLGGDPAPMSPTEFRSFIQSESARFARIVEQAKVTPEN
jgi:tripartite-type tricarboxylate transporter receptor subunit TctC